MVSVTGATLQGVEAIKVEVEVDLLRRLPAMDLPIALGILAASGVVPAEAVGRVLAVGELSLSGVLRPVRGASSMAMLARQLGLTLVLPQGCARRAALVPDAQVVGADTLGEVIAWLRGELELVPTQHQREEAKASIVDMADVRGREAEKRAMMVAAAGGHHMLVVGSPGCGKSMLARRLPTILPEMLGDEKLTVTRIHDAVGLLDGASGLVAERPFRAPHHSVTASGLLGDRSMRPGEVTLAHHGVLFLDEAPEFSRAALETLRQPLANGATFIPVLHGPSVGMPAEFQLVLAANPCPCGQRGSDQCRCDDDVVKRYYRRLPSVVTDYVDIRVDMAAMSREEALAAPPSIALQTALATMERRYGAGTIMAMNEAAAKVEVLPTGSLSLDAALGIGGYPRGRVVEVFGPDASGKTTLALHAIVECQKAGGTAAFIDAEHALDAAYARKLGVNVEHLLVAQPDNGEQALEIVEALVRSGAVELIVVDSVDALTPQSEIEGSMGDSSVGLQARLMSQALRKLTAIVHRNGVIVMFINQIRQKMGVTFGNGEVTSGGNALKFYSSIRLDIRRIGSVQSGNFVIGSTTRIRVVKNKLAPPFRMAEVEIIHGVGLRERPVTP